MSADTAPAAMPGVEEIARIVCRRVHEALFPNAEDWRPGELEQKVNIYWPHYTREARAILALFAEMHHATGERITRKDLNSAYREGSEKGRLAAHLIDGVSSPLNACCYRDGCRALETRAPAAEAAAREVLEHRVGDLPTAGYLRDNDASRKALAALAQIAAPGAAMEAQDVRR